MEEMATLPAVIALEVMGLVHAPYGLSTFMLIEEEGGRQEEEESPTNESGTL